MLKVLGRYPDGRPKAYGMGTGLEDSREHAARSLAYYYAHQDDRKAYQLAYYRANAERINKQKREARLGG